jgi:hypothetical protein
MQETLFGINDKGEKINPNETRIPNHIIFYELFKQRVGKSILEAGTGYCIDSCYGQCLSANLRNRQECRQKNLSQLVSGADISTLYNEWGKCVMAISEVCKDIDKVCLPNTPPENLTPKDVTYSNQMACATLSYMDDLKKSFLATENIQKKLEEDFGIKLSNTELVMANGDGKTLRYYAGGKVSTNENPRNMDDLTSLSSGEFEKAGIVGAAVDEQLNQIEGKCNGSAWDESFCSRYLLSDEESAQKEKDLDELELRSWLVGNAIDRIKDEESLKKYLEADDRSTEIIQNGNWEEVKGKIKEKYEREKKQTIDRLRAELTKRKQDPKYTTISNIVDEKKDAIKKLTQLAHYHNIVSGFLELKDNNKATDGQPSSPSQKVAAKKKETNVAAIYRELDNMKVQHEDDEYGSNENLKSIRQTLESSTDKPSDDDKSGVDFNMRNINDTLLRLL